MSVASICSCAAPPWHSLGGTWGELLHLGTRATSCVTRRLSRSRGSARGQLARRGGRQSRDGVGEALRRRRETGGSGAAAAGHAHRLPGTSGGSPVRHAPGSTPIDMEWLVRPEREPRPVEAPGQVLQHSDAAESSIPVMASSRLTPAERSSLTAGTSSLWSRAPKRRFSVGQYQDAIHTLPSNSAGAPPPGSSRHRDRVRGAC